ncbi:hypothetical protein BHE90_003060 [Fusarium euwallaceae]|uniref:Heterokaryon incompatibility domain-containing protein n=1 Tax=Fusarium euwallaceae TaxID=1147111 RepID=A0A430M304_9HYPO|nr:hypothetical protein BHE90_003060 [Fusarium euwallaceae]
MSAGGKDLGWVRTYITRAPVEELLGSDILRDASLIRHELEYDSPWFDSSMFGQVDHTIQWEIHATQRDGASMPPKICDLTTEAGQQEIAELVKHQWLERCCTLHKRCGGLQDRHQGLPPLPTRVLDVGTLEQPHLRLHVAGIGEREEYTCLSYCWGTGVLKFETTTATVDDLRKHIPFPALPKTIQDAIVFTRRLQVRYLWVDALCIIQNDNSNPSDWQVEAARFGTYYQNALCTLAASGSGDSSEGLFLPSLDRMYPTYFCTRLHRNSKESLYYTWTPGFHDAPWLASSGPLSARGWAVQERILSPRIVHFTRRCVIWECAELLASERSPGQEIIMFDDSIGELRRALLESSTTLERSQGGWGTFCGLYVQKGFTRLSDRLPALSGVVQRIQSHNGLEFYAGLWENHIIEGLDWYIHHQRGLPDSQAPIVPSWSWIKSTMLTGWLICQPMSWGNLFKPRKDDEIIDLRILSISTRDYGHGVDGVTTSGVITVAGELGMLNLIELGYEKHPTWDNQWHNEKSEDPHAKGVHWDRVPLEEGEVHGDHICLRLRADSSYWYARALILRRERMGEDGFTQYQRVGHIVFDRDIWDRCKPVRKVIQLI